MKTREQEDFILAEARSIMLNRIRKPGGIMSDMNVVRQYLTSEYATLENEQFGCMFLDTSYGLINHLKLFRGTISHCATYPREIAREALLQNAAFVILVHNHPAHLNVPSEDDIATSKKIGQILQTLDISLLDHIIVAGTTLFSMRTAGQLD